MKKGELSFSSKNLLFVKWHDQKMVTMLSTLHARVEYQEVIPQTEIKKPNPKIVLIPNVMVDYNKNISRC